MYRLERKLKESLLEVNVFGNIFCHLGFISYKINEIYTNIHIYINKLNKNLVFVAKTHNYNIFVAKTYYYALIDSF